MEEFCIITFDDTHHAIASEKALADAGFHIRIIPVPKEVTANCGLSIRFAPEDYEKIKPLVSHFPSIAFYKVRKKGLKKEIAPIA